MGIYILTLKKASAVMKPHRFVTSDFVLSEVMRWAQRRCYSSRSHREVAVSSQSVISSALVWSLSCSVYMMKKTIHLWMIKQWHSDETMYRLKLLKHLSWWKHTSVKQVCMQCNDDANIEAKILKIRWIKTHLQHEEKIEKILERLRAVMKWWNDQTIECK